MTTRDPGPFDGGCDCRHVRYRMTTAPLFVHCCHCRWCQRETGASFALNAMIESDRLQLLQGGVDMFGDRAFRDAVNGCHDPRRLAALFAAWPSPPGEGSPPEISARTSSGPQ